MHLRLRASIDRLAVGLLLFGALACSNPRSATPIPEPPALDPSKVGFGAVTVAQPAIASISGRAGAAPSGATVRMTNLDGTLLPTSTTAASDGSFSIPVVAGDGNELRFQAVLDGRRGEPVDFIYAGPPALGLSERHACVAVDPGFDVPFGAGVRSGRITLNNGCTGDLSVDLPRTRLGLPDFVLMTALPLSVAAGDGAEIDVQFSPSVAGEREDTLFIDVVAEGRSIRYPFTLFGSEGLSP